MGSDNRTIWAILAVLMVLGALFLGFKGAIGFLLGILFSRAFGGAIR